MLLRFTLLKQIQLVFMLQVKENFEKDYKSANENEDHHLNDITFEERKRKGRQLQ